MYLSIQIHILKPLDRVQILEIRIPDMAKNNSDLLASDSTQTGGGWRGLEKFWHHREGLPRGKMENEGVGLKW